MATSKVPPSDGEPSLGPSGPLSRVMAWLCALTAVGAVGSTLLVVLLGWNRPDPSLTRGAQIATLVAWIVSMGFLIWGLGNGRACFSRLAHGELFSRRTIAGLRNLALGMFLFKTASFLLTVGLMLVADALTITFGDLADGLFTLISLGAIVLIANVLTRAAEIAEDNAQIV